MANLAPYISSIRLIVVMFPFLAILLLLPLLIRQYHRYGAISGWLVGVNYAFVFYILCAYALTILPLPTVEQVRQMTGPTENFHLFDFIADFINYSGFVLTQPSTWSQAAKSSQFIQPFFNLLLTLPFGMFLRYQYKKSFLTSLVLSFGLTLSFELIQHSALFGLYPRPYRLFDVDDLFLNTCGAMLGWLISGSLGKLLPKKEAIVEILEERSHKVSVSRKSVAVLLDVIVIVVCNVAYNLIVGQPNQFVGILFYLLWVVLPELIGWSTLGQRLTHLQLTDKSGGKAGIVRVLMRNLFGYVLVVGLFSSELYVLNQTGTVVASELGIYYFLSLFGGFLILVFVLSLIVSLFTKQFCHEILSGTRLASTYQNKTEE
ncbi:VanZ family protein [Pseudolactococcus yaeyamensis]